MPSVKPKETEKSFVSRCIPTVLKEGTAKNQKQAAAICFSMFKEHQKKKHKSAKSDALAEALLKEIDAEKNNKTATG